jgi:predicted nucleic acid-binding protein
MSFVVDASATLPWCFEDEANDWTEKLLDRAARNEPMMVPAHWPVEVSNALLMAQRRQRIDAERAEWFWDKLSALRITLEPPLQPAQAKSILILAAQYRLTFYDAAYLELAQRLALPLATLDGELIKAASLAGVGLVD